MKTTASIAQHSEKVNASIELQSVNFHGDRLATAEVNGEIYVALRPIVEALGLSWQTQRRKITASKRWVHMNLPYNGTGGKQDMLFLPLKKLNAWLFSVNAAKVRPDIRERLDDYQSECCVVLHDYWSRGFALNPRLTADQLSELESQLARAEKLAAAFAPREAWGALSPKTGRPKTQPVRGYMRSPHGAVTRLRDGQIELVQQLFNFERRRLSA